MNGPITGSTTREIVESVEDGVQAGTLQPGTGLPSVRSLAAQLSVSPATAAAAYRDLRLRGIVSARSGSGTTIADRPALATPPPPAFANDAALRDLSQANPDPELLPDLSRALHRISTEHVLYGTSPLDDDLVTLAHEWCSDAVGGRPVEDYRLCVTGGALDAIERILRSRCRVGDEVGVEDPSYVGVLDLVRGMGLRPVGFAVDDSGPIAEDVADLLERGQVKTMIVTPRAQNPTGAAITQERAKALRRVLRAHRDVHVIENDYFSMLAGVPHHPLSARRDSWTVIRSMSKLIGPDLRMAVLVGDPRTIARVRGSQQLGTAWVSHLLQRLAVAVWHDPETPDLFTRAQNAYDERRRRLIDDLAGAGLPARGRTGFNVIVPVPEESAAVQGLAARGWQVRSGERHRTGTSPFIRITTATLSAADSAQLAADLAEVLAPTTALSAAP